MDNEEVGEFNFADCFKNQPLKPFPHAAIQCGPAAIETDRRIAALEKEVERLRDCLFMAGLDIDG